MWNGETYYSSGVYTYFTTNSNGCDSLAYLDLEIVNPTASYTYIDACDQYTWNGETYTETGVYSFETVNSVGCDSIVSLDLYIYPAAQTTAEVEVELSDDWPTSIIIFCRLAGIGSDSSCDDSFNSFGFLSFVFGYFFVFERKCG